MRRVTFLLGAGAMIEATSIGTSTITKKVIDSCKNEKLSTGKSILEQFSEDFSKKHKTDERTANFEDLFDILEGFVDYQYSDYNDSAQIILSCLKCKYLRISKECTSRLCRKFINVINNAVADYDKKYSTDGTWMRDFFHEYIKNKNIAVDVFNLNYDTWIEQILGALPCGYEDGFDDIDGYDDFQRFSNRKYLNHGDKHTISHLHGQICFDEANLRSCDINRYAYEEQEYSLYKYKSFELAENYRRRHIRSDIKTQSGHTVFPANIITGRMKTDKMLWSPLQMYMHGFIKALMENEELYIIGYGFGDQYINHLLYQYLQMHDKNKKVHIITKCSESAYMKNVIEHNSPFYCDAQSRFAQCVMGEIRWCNQFQRKDRYFSADSSAEIYINGFEKYCKEYVRKHMSVLIAHSRDRLSS